MSGEWFKSWRRSLINMSLCILTFIFVREVGDGWRVVVLIFAVCALLVIAPMLVLTLAQRFKSKRIYLALHLAGAAMYMMEFAAIGVFIGLAYLKLSVLSSALIGGLGVLAFLAMQFVLADRQGLFKDNPRWSKES